MGAGRLLLRQWRPGMDGRRHTLPGVTASVWLSLFQ